MEISILDVGHGFCAYVVADNGSNMLIDCGHNQQTGFHPADYLLGRGCVGINRFFVLNYDEDHLGALPRLLSVAHLVPIHILHRNTSITPGQLRALKRSSGPLGAGMTALLGMLESYTATVVVPPVYPGLEFSVFYNEFPTFTDTNNLSLVIFLHYPGISIVFPGDLETAGWRQLLARADFQRQLGRVNIFVASHHGRVDGYEAQVFDYCSPDIVVISDEAVQYETQEHNYSRHARGIVWNATDIRRVLTTRKDGNLTIRSQSGSYHVAACR
jgi:beta-lactamase superfamily II metal-dependent hydrolase